MARDIDWTEEAVARLRTLWAEGHSAADVGRRMGVSKNAIIGKAHRLHLTPRPSPIREKGTGTPRSRATPRVRGPSLPPLQVSAAGSVPQPSAPTLAATSATAPQPRSVTVFKPPTARDPCCWPFGEPGTREYRTCDDPSVPGKALLHRARGRRLRHAAVCAPPPGRPRARPLLQTRSDRQALTA